MKIATMTAVLAGAALLSLVGVQAQAGTCETGCTEKHSTCSRSGADYGACMTTWRQCKASCATPVRAAGQSAKPKAPTPAVVRH